MRKILVIVALIIGVISCGKNEDAVTGNYPEIVGTWRIVDIEVDGRRISQIPSLTEVDKQAQDCIMRSTFKFLANGDFIGVFYTSEVDLEVDPKYGNDRKKYVYKGCRASTTEGTTKYKIQGKKIIICEKDNDGSSTEIELFNIESLSGRTLKLSYSEEMKAQLRSAYERGKQILQQHNLKTPEYDNVGLNGFIIMEKQ